MRLHRGAGKILGLILLVSAPCQAAAEAGARIDLSAGWSIQSSAYVAEKGDAISVAGYRTREWYPTSVPATVFTALVNRHVYPDPDWGMNLRSIPGVNYGIGMNFSNIAMPPDSPFARSWWYRSEFQIPTSAEGKTLWLNFDAINYRANIWGQWAPGGGRFQGGRHVPHVRVRHHRTRPAGSCQRTGGRGISAHRERPDDHVRRLESDAS